LQLQLRAHLTDAATSSNDSNNTDNPDHSNNHANNPNHSNNAKHTSTSTKLVAFFEKISTRAF
jgi:hypothetical protein